MFVPKGLQDSSWGFNPRMASTQRLALKGATDFAIAGPFGCVVHNRAPTLPPYSGRRYFNRHLGLKPQAESCVPSGQISIQGINHWLSTSSLALAKRHRFRAAVLAWSQGDA